MRILFISQLFDPEYSIKGLALMQRLVAEGHQVEVLTTFPNYPTGKVFDGYSVKFRQEDECGGVRVIRLWSHISHSKSKLSRAWSYLSFTLMALFAALFSQKTDVVYTYHPQSTTGLIGLLMKLFRGVPFITDVQDLWPDALTATGMRKDGVLLRLISRWCALVYKHATQIVVLSEGFRQALIDRGVPEQKIHLVYNWCPEEQRIATVLEKNANSTQGDGAANFVYAGNMGSAQALTTMIKALGSFDKNDLTFTLIGGGVEKEQLKRFVTEAGYNNIFFSDYVPAAQIFDVLAAADVLVIHLKDNDLFRITIPSKTQSSMAMGKPILMAVGGEANQLLVEAKGGEVAEPEDQQSIQQAAVRLLSTRQTWPELGHNARSFYQQRLSMDVNYHKLLAVLLGAAK